MMQACDSVTESACGLYILFTLPLAAYTTYSVLYLGG